MPTKSVVDWDGRPLGCMPFEGPEKDLTLGYYSKIPNLTPLNFVLAWEIADATSEEGVKVVPVEEDVPGGSAIIGARINENLVNALKATFGNDYMLFAVATSGERINRDEWIGNYGGDDHDPMEYEAIKLYRLKKGSKGVRRG